MQTDVSVWMWVRKRHESLKEPKLQSLQGVQQVRGIQAVCIPDWYPA